MKEYQVKLQEELLQLDSRIAKMDGFVERNKKFADLSEVNRELILEQIKAMKKYATILRKRVKLLLQNIKENVAEDEELPNITWTPTFPVYPVPVYPIPNYPDVIYCDSTNYSTSTSAKVGDVVKMAEKDVLEYDK